MNKEDLINVVAKSTCMLAAGKKIPEAAWVVPESLVNVEMSS